MEAQSWFANKVRIITIQFTIHFIRFSDIVLIRTPWKPSDPSVWSFFTFKFILMKHMPAFHVGEETALAAIIAVLYFCSIMLFAYVFTLTWSKQKTIYQLRLSGRSFQVLGKFGEIIAEIYTKRLTVLKKTNYICEVLWWACHNDYPQGLLRIVRETYPVWLLCPFEPNVFY